MITIGTLLALLFISTGIVHSLNKTGDFNLNMPDMTIDLTFDAAFYYMIITIFTIGYGDYYPLTSLARAIIGLFIIIVIVIVSQQTSKLGELVRNTSPYRKEYRTDPNRHIIVSGNFSGTTLFRFLKELYHIDHNINMKSCRVLIVKDQFPSREILALLNHPVYEDTIQYLEGNLIDEKILKNSAVKLSKGVFILTDQYQEEVASSDIYAILVSSAVKEYSSSTPVFLQLVKPDLLVHNYWAGWNIGFSTWQLKLSMLAANVFTPGFSTFMCNLIVTSSGSMKKQVLNNHWVNEYIMGLSNELYLVPFPKSLIGSNFSLIVKVLYEKFDSLLIGVQTSIPDQDNLNETQEILLNPTNYNIRTGDKAFIITCDLEKAECINQCELTEENRQKSAHLSELFKDSSLFKTSMPKPTTQKGIENRHLMMWENDLRGCVYHHILVFGRIEHLEIILESFHQMTSQLICYVTDQSPGEHWRRISLKNKEVLYIECTLTDIEELSRTAINFAHHAILLSSKIPGSHIDDSGTLPLVSIIESNFTVKFTVELVDENNMKYMDNKFPIELENMSFLTWPRYAESSVFCSSALDYVMAQGYHNNFIIDLIRRMILYEDLFNQTGVDENCRINSIEVPEDLHGKFTFLEVFKYMLEFDRPIIVLAIYRGVGMLNNEIPYVFTKPDCDALIFKGDKLIVMGEVHNRDVSPYLKSVRHKLRKQTTINLSRKRSISRTNQTLLVQKSTLADLAMKKVEDDEKNDGNIISDEELLKMIGGIFEKNKREREIIGKQNKTLMNLASEFNTMQDLLNGLNINESLGSDFSYKEN